MRATTDPAARFSTLYRATYPDVLRYAKRRCSQPEDVAAETFTTAWRRVDDLPDELDDARAWLFGIARNTILNTRRADQRRMALTIRLDRHPQPDPGAGTDLADLRIDLTRAWDQLIADDQEVIALSVLEGLDASRAARVLDVSAAAYRTRLSRARARLRSLVDDASARTGVPAPITTPVTLVCTQES